MDFYRAAVHAHHGLDDRWNLARSLAHLAGALARQDSPEQARPFWEQALPLLADFDDPEAERLRQSITAALTAG